MKLLIEAPVDVTSFATLANAITSAHQQWNDARVVQEGSHFVVNLPDLPMSSDPQEDADA